MAILNANLQNVDSQEKLNPVPPGWYHATITDSEIKEGAKGPYILWTMQVDGYPNKIWEIMSLNGNGEAIGLKKLKTLAICAGHPDPNYLADTDELHGKRCQIRVKIEEDETGTYDPKNKITAFKPMPKNGSVQKSQVYVPATAPGAIQEPPTAEPPAEPQLETATAEPTPAPAETLNTTGSKKPWE